jgi:leucyl-tRNA synthetase
MHKEKEVSLSSILPGQAYSKEMARAIESKWMNYWYGNQVFKTPNPKQGDRNFYCLDMFPYPSGYGLHVGHAVGYIASDIYTRFKRLQGYNVLHPMGWDAFGLPAERYAIKTGDHPAETTKKNAETYKRQMNLMGLSFDWSREFSTTDPDYYKWTQLIFLRMYNAWFDETLQKARPIDELPIPDDVRAKGEKEIGAYRDRHRLVYYDESIVNWCPQLNSVVANEEVMNDGRTEQGFEVVRRSMRQVMMRITAYSERLLKGLDSLDWPESIKKQQSDWIGKSEGLEICFKGKTGDFELFTFTTRPDTLFGTTFLVLAPEHEALNTIVTPEQKAAVEEYVQNALQQGERARKQQTEKTGVFTGYYVKNPITQEDIPVFVADYVLMEHGTGVVMGVPAHDQRDFDFAKKYNLPIKPVFAPLDEEKRKRVLGLEIPWTDDAPALELDQAAYKELGLYGKSTTEVADIITNYLKSKDLGHTAVHYRMRDWVFARQRYWGDPIPLINWEDGTTTAVPEDELPLTLPVLNDYKPVGDGRSALSLATGWINVTDPKTGMKGKREDSTMPQWAGSCWYPLRFMDPHNNNWMVDPEIEKAWGPVDFYIGGAEHATLHLLYSRFWFQAMYDLGMTSIQEPFKKLYNQGMLTGFAYKTHRGVVVPIDDITETDGETYYIRPESEHYEKDSAELPLEKIRAKMSKSLRNVVNPDDVIAQYGADSFRMYIMFMAPVDGGREWETKNVGSMEKFLRRFWNFITNGKEEGYRNVVAEAGEDPLARLAINSAISGITNESEALKYNTAIAKIMICLNDISQYEVSLSTLKKLVLLLSPFAPFMAEELWQRLGNEQSITYAEWPAVDEEAFKLIKTVNIVITVNGKKRATIETDQSITDEALKTLVSESLSSTNWAINDSSEIIIIRDKKSGYPKLVNVAQK